MKWLWIILGIIVIGGLIYYFGFSNKYQKSYSGSSSQTTSSTSSTSTTTTGTSVNIANFSFTPGDLTVKVGNKVTWTNNDSVVHHVLSDTNVFDSGDLNQGQTYSFTFGTAGTFPYHCSIHPSMTGKIIVQ